MSRSPATDPLVVVGAALFLAAGVLVTGLLAGLVISSWREREARAALISAALAVLFALVWFGGSFWLHATPLLQLVAVAGVLAVALLCFLPIGRRRPLAHTAARERVDERDVIFAREEYAAGSAQHTAYYARRPELREIDDRLRALPELLARGGRYYDPQESPAIDAVFDEIEGLTTRVDGPIAQPPAGGEGSSALGADPEAATRTIKALALGLGAAEVGIARLDPMFVYSHVGRGPEPWGQPIENRHRFVIAFALEMRAADVRAAPRLPITRESARAYREGARISIALADWIRTHGYPARAHIAGSNYQIVLPAVARDAGLGELGRLGYLISPRYGPRVRLGAVTTDLPLVPDRPIAFGAQEFCALCRKCARSCPAGAIPNGGPQEVRGVRKWPLRIEACLHTWRVMGTDCGLCMRVCPYSHPPTFIHELIRIAIRRSAVARRLAVLGDDLLYGRRLTVNSGRGDAPGDADRAARRPPRA